MMTVACRDTGEASASTGESGSTSSSSGAWQAAPEVGSEKAEAWRAINKMIDNIGR